MSISVNQIVLHQLIKNQQDENIRLDTRLRQHLLPVSAEAEQLMLELHQAYQGKSKGYGIFRPQSDFARALNELLEQETDFLPFSYQTAALLCNELSKYAFAETGTLILCQYNFLATDYLFIALLDNRLSMLVDENLEIHRTQYLNIAQFDIAARINLTDLRLNADSNRYLTFIKGRVGRKIGDFFMDFLGAEEGLNPRLQNQCLLQAVEDYCTHNELNQNQTREIKKQVFDYCKGQLNNGEEIALTELSEELPALNQRTFAEFTAEQSYELAPSIPPVAAALKSLTKYSGSGKGISLSFDAALLDERILWDEEKDMLTIKGLPPNLKDQLRRRQKTDI
ncbi:nucleoid-associated protein [Mesocricetibacter intestinalis]|uniref:Nucleoid-associated protein EDC45_0167 n=1 Tax=Mesocricetibacter intestinalis TaxID=1521930 RepID=A0A4R6VBE3_9PAST|nr:nucleoid-associated protein YejK [Mesocricetibacter intestinalis]TDQ59517.1 nucleoid-associated protein [Mesocricetibacter intestinalis]